MLGMKSEHRTTGEDREQVAFRHEFCIFLPFSLLLENWCFLCCSSGVGIYNPLQGKGRQGAAGSYGMGSFEGRRLYIWRQSITSPLAARESWCSLALSSQFTPVQIKCKTALAGAWVWCCRGCLQPSGSSRESWKLLGVAGALDLAVGWPSECHIPAGLRALAGEVCWLGAVCLGSCWVPRTFCWSWQCSALYYGDFELVYLGRCGEEAGLQWGRDGTLVPPCPPRSTIPWLPTRISFRFLSLPDRYEKWHRIRIAFLELEKEKCESAFSKSGRRRVRPAALCTWSTGVQREAGWWFCPQLYHSHEQHVRSLRQGKNPQSSAELLWNIMKTRIVLMTD